MGQLLRSPQENFQPQIHTEANSLALLMSKHMEVRNKVLTLFSRYTKTSSWLSLTDRVNGGVNSGKILKAGNEISDNAYRVSYEGALILPIYSNNSAVFGGWHDPSNPSPNMTAIVGVTYTGGATVSTIATNTLCSIAVKHDPANGIFGDKLNPTDKVILGNGVGIELIVARERRLASTRDHYVYDCKTIGPASLFKVEHLALNAVLTESGNAQGEGSLNGYQRSTKNKWEIHYSSKKRYTLTMTGDAKRQKVSYIYNSDSKDNKYWEFSEVLKAEQYFNIAIEQSLRHSRKTMDATGHKWFENYGTNLLTLNGFVASAGMTAPMQGDGYIPMIQDSGVFDYNPNSGLSYKYVEAIMNALAQRSPSGSSGNVFLFVTDRIGRMVVDAAMKKLISWGEGTSTNTASTVETSVTTGNKTELGFEFSGYHYLGNKIILLEDELLNNPGLYPTSGGVTGTGNIYIINATPIDGVSNFEIFNGAGRGYIKKYIDGLHSFDASGETSHAPSGFDGMRMDLFSESMAVVYYAKSCGILKASQAWAGGSLAGSDWLNANANAESFLF